MSSKKTHASVAKLVDATDSKSVDSNIMLVQVRPEVPKINSFKRKSYFFVLHGFNVLIRYFFCPMNFFFSVQQPCCLSILKTKGPDNTRYSE